MYCEYSKSAHNLFVEINSKNSSEFLLLVLIN